MSANQLLLSEYLELTTDFAQEPTFEKESRITDWLSQLEVREYMPMKEKALVMMDILSGAAQEYDVPGLATHLEMCKMARGLLRYCTNLENDVEILSLTMGAYDNIQIYGLAKVVRDVCHEDYGVLCSMVDNTFNISNVKTFADTAALLNKTEYDKWVNTMKQLKSELTPEVLQGLIAASNMSAPEFADLSQALAETALRDAANQLAAAELREQAAAETPAEQE